MPPDQITRIDNQINSLLSQCRESDKSLVDAIARIKTLEGQMTEVRVSLAKANDIIKQNRMVIQMIKWAVVGVLPATLSVFGALAFEILRKGILE
jgi:chromosome segregation ATPase